MTQSATGVVGLGLIGGSVAAALRGHDNYVVGYDSDPAALQSALDADLIDKACDGLEPAIGSANTVVLAVPPLATVEILQDVDRFSMDSALIVDTAGVKAPVVAAMEQQKGAHRFVGGHPLAGSERSGSQAARPDLFNGRPFALVKNAQTLPDFMAKATHFVESLGARPLILSAGEHDSIVARTSHTAQLVSSALAASIHDGDERLAGPGLSGMSRLAASSPDLWLQILELNRAEITRACRHFASTFDRLRLAIEAGDTDDLENTLKMARQKAIVVRSQTE